MRKILECVPNFSEGRDESVIQEITNVIKSVNGVYLLHVDCGESANRSVVTFAGDPLAVVEAAFRAIKIAASLIDMRKHNGIHPRFGATDVCPLVPVSGISMDEVVTLAGELGKRVGSELGIPVYCYGEASFSKNRRSLSACRSGQYEGLKKKMANRKWKPDFGPDKWSEHVARTGAVSVGARDFLIAYNVNLNTKSVDLASAIAAEIRESGQIIRTDDGTRIKTGGKLKEVYAMAWQIPEYDRVQVSMNLTDISVTPIHVAFEEVQKSAFNHGVKVTGSELIGLIPLRALLDAGRYFLSKQGNSDYVSDEELINVAVDSLGLAELDSFNPRKRVIEYLIQDKMGRDLMMLPVKEFIYKISERRATPAGGTITAVVGAMGAALVSMVAGVTEQKKRTDEESNELILIEKKCLELMESLMKYADLDARAYKKVIEAFNMPNSTKSEAAERDLKIEESIIPAIEIPLEVMRNAEAVVNLASLIAGKAIKAAVSDALVAAITAHAAIEGALVNIKSNILICRDRDFTSQAIKEGITIATGVREEIKRILKIVDE